MRWDEEQAWEAWAVNLASGVIVYCDDDGEETRVLASAKRGNPLEADGFFLELLAETRGQAFGMEMAGDPPARAPNVRSPIGSSSSTCSWSFLKAARGSIAAEGNPADGRAMRAPRLPGRLSDWLTRTLAPPPDRDARRQPRRRDESPFG